MSLSTTFQRAAQQARVIGGDLFESCDVAVLPDAQVLDDGQIVHLAPVVLAAVPVLFADYTIAEQFGGETVESLTQTAYIAGLDFAATPRVGHVIRRPDGSTWRVRQVTTDPVRALWTLAVERAPGGWPA